MAKQMHYNPETKKFEPVAEVPVSPKPKSKRKSKEKEELA